MKNDIENSTFSNLYKGRNAFHGELHDHASTGGTSDGGRCLNHWRCAMEALEMDFAAILDHRQVRHMFLPVWDNNTFICGTEPGTCITDLECESNEMHYNMIFDCPKPLMEILEEFEEFGYTGGKEGHFNYPHFTRERFCQLINRIKEKNGFFVFPHPKQIMKSDKALDYYFCDEIGMEVFYWSYDHSYTKENYKLWTELLAKGKRIWACAGGDKHSCASNDALTTVYAENKTNATLLSYIKKGDFTCGGVGIRMCIGNVAMGGCADFNDILYVSIRDFHKRFYEPNHHLRFDLINETGIVASIPFSCETPFNYNFSCNPDSLFYRVEIFDETRKTIIAIGNPIWNKKYYL